MSEREIDRKFLRNFRDEFVTFVNAYGIPVDNAELRIDSEGIITVEIDTGVEWDINVEEDDE